jgi:hypothetical protein
MMQEGPKGKMKLGKLAMPKKKPMESEMELELGGEEMAELGDSEMEMGEDEESLGSLMGEEEGAGELEDGPAAMLSDDELLAELRKRGLSSKAAKASTKPSSDDEYLA